MAFHHRHHPLRDYTAALEAGGFVVESLREPVPGDEYVAEHPEVAKWRATPCFLHGLARRSD